MPDSVNFCDIETVSLYSRNIDIPPSVDILILTISILILVISHLVPDGVLEGGKGASPHRLPGQQTGPDAWLEIYDFNINI